MRELNILIRGISMFFSPRRELSALSAIMMHRADSTENLEFAVDLRKGNTSRQPENVDASVEADTNVIIEYSGWSLRREPKCFCCS
jgi:hypothetical protein